MLMTLTDNEMNLVRAALAQYSTALRDEARPLCCGYSPEGVALCQRRIEVDLLIEGLDNGRAGTLKTVSATDDSTRRVYRPYLVDERAA